MCEKFYLQSENEVYMISKNRNQEDISNYEKVQIGR